MARRGPGAALLIIFALARLSAPAADFDRDILPILSDRCFACHGPDAVHRQAGLRLDVDGGAKTVADKLVARIAATDSTRMPPAWSGKPALSERQIALLREWLRDGAPWRQFWSFVPPRRPALPAVKNQRWPRN